MTPQRWNYLLGTLLAALTLWFALHLHTRSGYFNYKSELFSDKAGYYIYLPATFIYDFDGAAVPDSLPAKLGRGFHVTADGKIVTKYPIGVAVLQAPFFMATHYLVAPALGHAQDGFSPPYHKMVDVAAWAYLLLGLLIMGKVLGAYFKPPITWAVLLCFLLGTNLLYYYAVESGMSHVYSFFLVSALLRLTQVAHRRGKIDPWLGLAMGIVAALLVMTRFTNGLLLSVVLLWEVGHRAALRQRLQLILSSKGALLALVGPLALIGMQMGYYFYVSGHPLHYAYGGEGFDWTHPSLLRVWLSPHNGLLPYSPMVVVGLAGLGWMIRHRIAGGWHGLVLFLLASYVFSCWWQWYFGCAYGARSFVEYYPLLMVAAGYIFQWLARLQLRWRIAGWGLLVLVMAVNAKNSYLYKRCYLGTGDWDWGEWWDLVCQL